LARRADEVSSSQTKPTIPTIIVNYSDPSRPPEIIEPPRGDQEPRHDAQEIEARQDAKSRTLGFAFVHDADGANAFSKLSRYETAIERSLYKALHELQRLQAGRNTEGNVPPPAIVDVEVSEL
jgi:hypothetical protein